jgi:hypothetical protein
MGTRIYRYSVRAEAPERDRGGDGQWRFRDDRQCGGLIADDMDVVGWSRAVAEQDRRCRPDVTVGDEEPGVGRCDGKAARSPAVDARHPP